LLKASCKNVLDKGTIRLDNDIIHQRLNVGHPKNYDDNFLYWLVGVTDGDGTFWYGLNSNGSWDFTFKIS